MPTTKPKAETANIKLSLVEGAKAYAQLKKDVEAEGILDRAYGYYAAMALFTFGGFLLVAFLIYLTPSLIVSAILTVLLTFFSIQVGGLLHDAGHRAIFNSAKWNDFVGHICGFFMVDSIDAWREKHNKHHASTNEIDEDPDLDNPLHQFTTTEFAKRTGFAKLLLKNQVYTYFPLRTLVFISRRVAGLTYLISTASWKSSWKLGLFFLSVIAFFALPFILFDATKAIVLIAIFNLTGGFYFANIFAPNHKGMPELKKGQKISFLEQQIITSRNLKGGYITELFFIGLNYQIEHHLFTNCPRNKLKLITPHVKKLCKKLGLEFSEVGLIETNKIILGELRQVAATAA